MKIEKMYLSVHEVAIMTGFSEQSVRRLAREGRLPGRKVGAKFVFRIDEVHDAIRGKRS